MSKLIVSFLFACVYCNAKSQDTITHKSFYKNQLFLSIGAPSIYTGISFERLVINKSNLKILPRVGLGFNIFRPSLGKEYDIHTGLTILYGKNIHFIETGCGLIHYLINQYDYAKEDNYIHYKSIAYCLLGYRLNFSGNSLAMKIAITPIFVMNKDKWTFFPLAEIGIGYRI